MSGYGCDKISQLWRKEVTWHPPPGPSLLLTAAMAGTQAEAIEGCRLLAYLLLLSSLIQLEITCSGNGTTHSGWDPASSAQSSSLQICA